MSKLNPNHLWLTPLDDSGSVDEVRLVVALLDIKLMLQQLLQG